MRRIRLLLLGVLCGLAAAELGVRLVEAATGRDYAPRFGATLDFDEMMVQPHPYIGYMLRPGASSAAGQPAAWSTNALGFRGPEIDPQKAPDTLRVACLGGSTTWGSTASSDATTWPAALERALQASLPADGPYRRVEVINAGVMGYTLMESFVNLKMRVLPLQPDVVVIYHAINDARIIGRPGFQADYTHVRGPWRVPVPSTADVVFQWSHLYGLLFADARDRPDLYDIVHRESDDRPAQPAQLQVGVAHFVQTLRQTVAVAEASGARVVLTSFAYTLDLPANKEWMPSYGFALVDRINAGVRALAQETGLPFADVAAAIGGRGELFNDCIHLKDAGNDVVASTVADAIRDAGLLTP